MKIAFLGSRGIPARYSGFETFYEQLATRLAQRGHHVTVYNRSHFIKDIRGRYQGVRLVTLPSIPTKHLDTTTHTLVSSLHATSPTTALWGTARWFGFPGSWGQRPC